ncbi:uncharacterized protein LOC132195691 [Neocloeon triangulifer]|uniref:uncharacterized protein LOC132195691 n=1 Tax=Neocloeon triangulifer TaxID=2078957 RepID=UPI00286F78D9|nr:uncharacterized protein LOC132195691 [Neocloeon triangulifer]
METKPEPEKEKHSVELKSAGNKKLGVARERKLEALEKGERTDCVFLVGSDESTAVAIHGNKFDLEAASEYFEGLFRSPLTPPGPIRVKHVEPRIFRMVVEFAHFFQLFTPPVNVEEAVLLARSADEFLMTELGTVSVEFMSQYLDVDKVWKIYEMNNLCRFVAEPCEKFFCERTMECLNHQSFLGISKETLISFLKISAEMDIDSESDLVHACLKLASAKNSDDDKRKLIRSALPNLRLLTLDEEQISALSEFLTDQEKTFLFFKKHEPHPCLLFPTGPSTPESICPIETPRCRVKMKTFTLLPDLKPVSLRDTLEAEHRIPVQDTEVFTFSFEASEFIVIRGFDIFCQMIDPPESILSNFKDEKNSLDSFAEHIAYDKNLDVSVKVSSCDMKYSGAEEKLAPTTSSPFVTNSWVHFGLNVLVPKGGTFEMSVTFKESCYYRFERPLSVVMTDIPKWNDPSSLKLFKNIKFSDQYVQDDKLDDAPEDQALTVFRKLYFTLL